MRTGRGGARVGDAGSKSLRNAPGRQRCGPDVTGHADAGRGDERASVAESAILGGDVDVVEDRRPAGRAAGDRDDPDRAEIGWLARADRARNWWCTPKTVFFSTINKVDRNTRLVLATRLLAVTRVVYRPLRRLVWA